MLRLKGMKALSDKAESQGELTEAQTVQWQALIRKFCSPSAPARFDAGDAVLDEACDGLQAFFLKPKEAKQKLDHVLKYAETKVDLRRKADEKKARRSWRDWIAQQMKGGAASGMAHNFVKRVEEDPQILMRCSNGLSAAPQDVAQGDLEEWNKVWQALEGRGSAPWRQREEDGGDERGKKIQVRDVRRAVRSFKERTAVGIDGIAPRQLDWLSDTLLRRVIEFLEVVEEKGRWPGNVALGLMHLIPKPQGGRRPIAIIATLVRVWVKCRKEG